MKPQMPATENPPRRGKQVLCPVVFSLTVDRRSLVGRLSRPGPAFGGRIGVGQTSSAVMSRLLSDRSPARQGLMSAPAGGHPGAGAHQLRGRLGVEQALR
jgi:hypothetical protein